MKTILKQIELTQPYLKNKSSKKYMMKSNREHPHIRNSKLKSV